MGEKGHMGHAELVKRAGRWLLNSCGCGFTLLELAAYTTCGEEPDAIGWKSGISILVECKASRGDFLSDKKKYFRKYPETGMGRFRYYMTLPGMIKPEDLPEGWGLLYCHPRKIERVVDKIKGNIYMNPPFKANLQAEIQIMASALRRIHIRGDLGKIYEPLKSQVLINDSNR